MRLLARHVGVCGMLLAGAAVLAVPAGAAISLSVALKNYYAEYEIVEQCARHAQLTKEDVDTAGTALVAIEKYYLGRDHDLNTAHLRRQAVADKNDSFKILERSGESGVRPYCQMSLNELVRKAKEVGEPASAD
ncbi:hypothetical protein [Methyloceanibacter caenitepidi]|nr:hypothetical protein [Methyloceanibacter caenitepidi]